MENSVERGIRDILQRRHAIWSLGRVVASASISEDRMGIGVWVGLNGSHAVIFVSSFEGAPPRW